MASLETIGTHGEFKVSPFYVQKTIARIHSNYNRVVRTSIYLSRDVVAFQSNFRARSFEMVHVVVL